MATGGVGESGNLMSAFEEPVPGAEMSVPRMAMERAIAAGELHPGAREDILIPVFRYSADDIANIASDVPSLTLKGVIESEIHMGAGLPTSTLFSLYWAIFESSLRASVFPDGGPEADVGMRAMERHSRDVMHEIFEDGVGARVPYISIHVERKDRGSF